jgi:hypothetical protein
MDGSINDFMIIGVNIILRDNPAKSVTGEPTFHSEFQIIGQLPMDDFQKLRKVSREPTLTLRCDFGEYNVMVRHLEYDAIKETYSLYVVQKH